MLILIINQGWSTIQVGFSYSFVQDTLVEDFYLALPYYSDSDTGEDRANMVMNIKKSLYGLYNHLNSAFGEIGLKQIHMDPYMIYGIVMITLIDVDDVLLFGTNQDNIDEFIKKLEDSGILLTVEEGVYDLLGI